MGIETNIAPRLVRWCSDHETWSNPDEGCPGDGWGEKCHTRKRRMYICPLGYPKHCDDMGFFTREGLNAHILGDQ